MRWIILPVNLVQDGGDLTIETVSSFPLQRTFFGSPDDWLQPKLEQLGYAGRFQPKLMAPAAVS